MPPVFAFGSFGDFISLLQIADEMRRAILDQRSAYVEYIQLVEELDKLIKLLESMERTQEDFTRITDGAYDQELITYADKFIRSVNDTKALIEEYNRRLALYDTRSTSIPAGTTTESPALAPIALRGTRVLLIMASRRVRWSFSSTRKDAKDLRIRLAGQYMIISMLRQEILTIMLALSA